MDRWIVILSGLCGYGIAFPFHHLLGPKRRTHIGRPLWWLCISAGTIIFGYGISHSTVPTFASRVTVIGRASSCVERRSGKNLKFELDFTPDGSRPVNLETQIITPHWGDDAMWRGRTLRITYIDSMSRSVINEVVDLEILSGDHAGWHDSLDPDPLGIWLAAPIGAAIASFGLLGNKFRNDDLWAVERSEGNSQARL